jgi:hypothetical protein
MDQINQINEMNDTARACFKRVSCRCSAVPQ